MPSDHITVLFLKADSASSRMLAFLEHLAHVSDFMYNEVHAELLIQNCGYAAVGMDTKGNSSCVLKYTFRKLPDFPCLEFVHVPVSDADRARRIADEIWHRTRASYAIPVLDLALPSFVVRDVGVDPSHWDHLYCSQFVLLFLRICSRERILALPEDRLAYLEESHTSSLRCTPAHLRHVLRTVLGS